jgi:DNA-3-methyladenine glycosylase II
VTRQYTLEPRGPFSLHSAISFLQGFAPAMHGRGGQVGHLHLAFVPDGERRAAGACVRSQGGELVVEISGAAEPNAAARQVERILSLDVDGSGFADVGERDPVIGRLQARYPGLRPVSFPSPFEAGAWFVLSQRLRAAQAVALKARMSDELGERVAICGEERAAFPAPGVVAELEGLAGLPARKLATLRALGQAATQGELDGERLRAMGAEAAVEELQRLPGVGPFTAQGIVVRGAGEPDYLATAEPRMAQAAALAYGLDAPLAPEELARRGEVWRPYRSWVGLLLRLGLQDASHETRPRFEMHWRGGERGGSRDGERGRSRGR